MFALDPSNVEFNENKDKFKWESYPSLPNGLLVDSVSIDDEKMFVVSKDKKLFEFTTYNSLSMASK